MRLRNPAMPSSGKLEIAILEGPDTYTGVSKPTTILSTSPATPVLLITTLVKDSPASKLTFT